MEKVSLSYPLQPFVVGLYCSFVMFVYTFVVILSILRAYI